MRLEDAERKVRLLHNHSLDKGAFEAEVQNATNLAKRRWSATGLRSLIRGPAANTGTSARPGSIGTIYSINSDWNCVISAAAGMPLWAMVNWLSLISIPANGACKSHQLPVG